MEKQLKNGTTVKITRAGRLYVNGEMVHTMSDGQPICTHVTPLNLPNPEVVGNEVFEIAHDWAAKNYHMTKN